MVTNKYNKLLQRLGRKERLRITWGAAPAITVVRLAPHGTGGMPRHARSQSPGSSSNEKQRRGLLGMLCWRGGALLGGAGSGAGQVWAAWQGPGHGADTDGYELLLDSPAGGGSDGQQAAGLDIVPADGAASQGVAQVSVGLRTRLPSGDQHEEDMTPRHLHSRLLAQHRQSLLTSPLSSVHAGVGEWCAHGLFCAACRLV